MLTSQESDSERVVAERWSAKAKRARSCCGLFRGEIVDAVSSEIHVLVHEIETWRMELLESGAARLKKRGGDPHDRALQQTQATVGELTMKWI